MPELSNPAQGGPTRPPTPGTTEVPKTVVPLTGGTVNRTYQPMDTDHRATGPIESYEPISSDLDGRAQQAMNRGPAHQLKETFRDNPLDSRFELLIGGAVAAHVTYTTKGGQVVLTDGVEHPGFRDQGMDVNLMRHIVLNAHQQRLSLIPQCPMAFSFLADHPQYQALTARSTH
jgi:predicted GNAT family acetyltransferase